MIEMITHLTAAALLFFFVVIVRKYVKNLGSYFLEFGVSIITGGLLLTEISETFGYNIILVGIVVTFFGVIRIFKRLKEIAIKDYLTGLYTRYYFFEEWLPREMERQKRKNGKGISFLIIDLDDFKTINDKYSHRMGDKLLKYIASEIIKNIRKTDCAVRFGGDEILVAFPDVDAKTVENIVKRLEKKLFFNPVGLPIGFSYGIETWKPGENVEGIVQNADLQMYTLKNLKKQKRVLSEKTEVD